MPETKDDIARIDEAALGLLYLTLHDDGRAWKGPDFAIFDRLQAAGLIHNPVSKTKSVAFTEKRPRRRGGRLAEVVQDERIGQLNAMSP